MQKEKMKEKIVLFVISTAVVLLFVAVTMISKRVARGNVTYPLSTLNINNDGYFYTADNRFPYMYEFSDVPYAMGVPSEGIAYVEGGYAYNTDAGFGLTVAEISKRRTISTYKTDVIGSLYSTYGGEELYNGVEYSGWLNGFSINESIDRISFKEHKNMIVMSYALDVSSEWIVICAYIDEPDKQQLKDVRDYLDAMVKMTQSIVRSDFEKPDEISEGTGGLIEDNGDEVSTVNAEIEAEQDYETMRLAFVYLDVTKTVDEVFLQGADGSEYIPVSNGGGEIVFAIPDVHKGDIFTLKVSAGDLAGCYVEMSEMSEYTSEQESYSEGNLHVEDETEPVETETAEEAVTENDVAEETADETFEDVEDTTENAE